MKFNKFFIVLVVLLAGFLLVNASVATELDDSVIADSASSNQDISINDVDNNVKAGDAGSDINKLGNEEKNFAYLNDLIQNTPEGGEVTLDADIKFNSSSDIAFKNGILVNKSITINGNNSPIFCFHLARAFNIAADNVTITGLSIYDGNATEGGAIYWSGNDGTIMDCSIELCSATNRGGAIYFAGDNCGVSGCSFSEDNSTDGGAIYFAGDNCELAQVVFSKCEAVNGGSIYWAGDDGAIMGASITGGNAVNGQIYWSGANASINSFQALSVGEPGVVAVNGGVLYFNNTAGDSYVDNSIFFLSEADNGSVVYCNNVSHIEFDGCYFFSGDIGNVGIIYCNNINNFVVKNCTLLSGSHPSLFDGIYCNNVNGSIINSIFKCFKNCLYLNQSNVKYEDNFWGTSNTISAKEFKDQNIITKNGVSVVPDNFIVLNIKLIGDSCILEFVNNGTKDVVSLNTISGFTLKFSDGSDTGDSPVPVGKKYKLGGKSLVGAYDEMDKFLAAPPFEYNISGSVKDGVYVLKIDVPSKVTGNFTVKVNGKVFTGIIKKGSVSIPLTGLAPGSYTLEIFYSGDKYNLPFNTTFNITIPKPVPKPDPTNHSGIPMEHTGNPLIALLFALITLPILRRK